MRSTFPLLLGHRGDRKSAPENTLTAFDLAMANGCDGFEFDVRMTRDNEALLCHDPDFLGMPIATTDFDTLAEKYSTLIQHNAQRDQTSGVTAFVARLENVFERYASSAFLDIELKTPGAETKVTNLIREHPPARGYVISSFLAEVLANIAREFPHAILGWIFERPEDLSLWQSLPVQYVIPHYSLVTSALVAEAHSMAKRVLVWTVNDATAMRQMADFRVDGIISDDALLLVQTLKPAALGARP